MTNTILGRIVTCNRLRTDTDGPGVTTLVAMKGCPLKCKYCINNNLYKSKDKYYSAETLYRTVCIDDLYFNNSGGGVCFGGHEPLLQADYIKKFKELLNKLHKSWKITLETSLNVNSIELLKVIDIIDYWIIDIKDMNDSIYKNYTGLNNQLVKENLRIIKENVSLSCIKIRLPLIKNFNSIDDIESSKKELKNLGFEEECFDMLEYII